MASEGGPARQAVKEAADTLVHWSSAVSVVAVVVAAHWLAISEGAGDHAGLVYGTSFVVFALLLPAVSLVREVVLGRIPRLQELLRSDRISADVLELQRQMFGRLAETVKSLQRGIVLTVLAAIASSVAIIAPRVIVWDHAPDFLVFSFADLLTALALVCLVGTVAAMFPFTWHLLIRSQQLHTVEKSIRLQAQLIQPTKAAEPTEPTKAAEPAEPQSAETAEPAEPQSAETAKSSETTGRHPRSSTNADGTGTDAAPGA
jgi:hypothetical protein